MKTKKLSMQQIETHIHGIYTMAKVSYSTSNFMHDRFSELTTILTSKTASGKRRYSPSMLAFAQGYYHALNNSIIQNDIEFCYVYDNVIYSTHAKSNRPNAEFLYSKGCDFMDSLERGHYWKNSDKVFF